MVCEHHDDAIFTAVLSLRSPREYPADEYDSNISKHDTRVVTFTFDRTQLTITLTIFETEFTVCQNPLNIGNNLSRMISCVICNIGTLILESRLMEIHRSRVQV